MLFLPSENHGWKGPVHPLSHPAYEADVLRVIAQFQSLCRINKQVANLSLDKPNLIFNACLVLLPPPRFHRPTNSQMARHDPIADAKAQEATHNFLFRLATMEDIPALQAMIGESLRALGKGYYTDAELDGSIGYLFGPDTVLILDQ